MVDIRDYLAKNLTAEREFSIEAKVMVWLNAGAGKVLAVESAYFAMEGRVQIMGYERPLSVQLSLGAPVVDGQGVTTGPCTLRLGGQADGEAVYRVEGQQLVLLGKIDGKAVRVAFKEAGRHTLVDLDAGRKFALRLTAG